MVLDRYSHYIFRNGLGAKNRVVVPPMASQTADAEGLVTAATIQHYRRLAQSAAGLIFVEYSYIHSTGKGEIQQLSISSDEHIKGLTQIAHTIHDSQALAGIQLVHAGGKTSSDITGSPLMSASKIPVPVKGWQPEVPIEMNELQIQSLVQWFLKAAERAVAAGFDIVELHAAHGYGLNQWLSPLTNQRRDRFGQGIQGQSLLLLNIVSEIKTKFPQVLLAVRLPAQDHLPGGLSIQDMSWVVSELETLGVDLIDVSSGIGGWRRPEGHTGQGYLIEDAAQIKIASSLPVIGVGGIESGEYIDQTLSEKKVDFTAVGRAILKDPLEWQLNNLPVKKTSFSSQSVPKKSLIV